MFVFGAENLGGCTRTAYTMYVRNTCTCFVFMIKFIKVISGYCSDYGMEYMYACDSI